MTSASLRLRVIQGESGRSLSKRKKTTRTENGKKRQAPLQTSDTCTYEAYADKFPFGERTRSSSLERNASDGVVLAYVPRPTTILGDHGETAANHPLARPGGEREFQVACLRASLREPRGKHLLLVGVTRKRTRYTGPLLRGG